MNLIIDISNIFYRSLFTVNLGYNKFGCTFSDDTDVQRLIRKVATDVSYIIRQTNASRIIFAFDSKSWRKSIQIEENYGYKSSREKSDKLDWNNIYRALNEFETIFDTAGFICSKIDSSEADDLISLWADEFLTEQHQNVMIVSGDEDVRQLVKMIEYDNKKLFCTVLNPFIQGKIKNKKLYIPNGFETWLNEEEVIDIFNVNIDTVKENFIKLRDKEKIIFEHVDGNDVALYKLFCGDDGDDVPAFYTWINDKGKECRITNSLYEKIKTKLNINCIEDINTKKLVELEQVLSELVKHKPNIDIKKRFERQLKLVVLDQKYFPKEILHKFSDIKTESLSRPQIYAQQWNLNTILEGTRYVSEKGTIKSNATPSSIFKDIDKHNGPLF